MAILFIAIAWLLTFPFIQASFNSSYRPICSVSNAEWSLMHDPDTSNHTHFLETRATGGITRWHRPWPITDWEEHGRLRVIEYCFHTTPDREKLWCAVQEAIRMWYHYLGGPAGPHSGHNLAFNEFMDENDNPLPCYTEYDQERKRGWWNEEVPGHVMSIKEAGAVAWSSVGYVPEETSQERHHMRLPMPPRQDSERYQEDMKYWLQTAVHEMGHAIGLLHEHQRPDRDYFVQWRCDKMLNYAQTFHSLTTNQHIPPAHAHDLICLDIDKTATQAGIPTHSFLIPHIDPRTGNEIAYDLGSPYDFTSIMQYESTMGAPGERCDDQADCPMVRILRNEGGEVPGYAKIEPNWVPSAWDVAFVKKYYPWVGWADGHGPGGKRKRGVGQGRRQARNGTVFGEWRGEDGSMSYVYRVRSSEGV